MTASPMKPTPVAASRCSTSSIAGSRSPTASSGSTKALELTHPLVGLEAPIAVAGSEEGKADRRTLALGDQQPGITGAHPALELAPASLPGVLRAPEWCDLADLAGTLAW